MSWKEELRDEEEGRKRGEMEEGVRWGGRRED